MEKKNSKLKYIKLFGTVFFVFSCLIFVFDFCYGSSTSMYLSPTGNSYFVGNTFSVVVKIVSSNEQAINAAEATLIFNPEEIEVVSTSKSNSIFNLWTAEPTFSNSGSYGSISFGGGSTAGFTGVSGTVLTITFKAKASSLTKVTFSSGAILAADGSGTNILTNMQDGIYTIKAGVDALPTEPVYIAPAPVVYGKTPDAPRVLSPVIQWRAENSFTVSWVKPTPGIIGVSFLLHKVRIGNPGSISDGLLSSKEYKNIKDGTWYFHIKFKNQYGWGKITHHKILIDTQPPEPFEIEIENGGDCTDSSPYLYFDTKDTLSGVEYYEVEIGDKTADVYDNPYRLPPQEPGTYEILVRAFDKAGNFATATTIVIIEPKEVLVPEATTTLPDTLKFSQRVISFLVTAIFSISLVVVLILVIIYILRRVLLWKRRVKEETKDATQNVSKAFSALRSRVAEQVKHLNEKTRLTKQEKELRNKLQEALDTSDDFIINEEIGDMEDMGNTEKEFK